MKNLTLSEKIKLGVNRGAARALREHKKAGRSIVVMQKGKIVKIPPEKIEIPKTIEDQ
jgi:hypothetical protein